MEPANETPNPDIKVGQELADELSKVAEVLPRGAYSKIAEMCDVSDEYVRRFFKGHYAIKSDNIKILDAANKVLDAELAIEDKARKKAADILNKARVV